MSAGRYYPSQKAPQLVSYVADASGQYLIRNFLTKPTDLRGGNGVRALLTSCIRDPDNR